MVEFTTEELVTIRNQAEWTATHPYPNCNVTKYISIAVKCKKLLEQHKVEALSVRKNECEEVVCDICDKTNWKDEYPDVACPECGR